MAVRHRQNIQSKCSAIQRRLIVHHVRAGGEKESNKRGIIYIEF